MASGARAVIAVVFAAAMVGCAPTGGHSPSATLSPSSTPPSTPAPKPSPTPSPSPTAFPSYPVTLPTEDPVTAAVIHGWQEYQRVYEKFGSDPLGTQDLTETQYVTTGEEATGLLDSIDELRRERLRLGGGMVFRNVEVDVVSPSQALVHYCLDLTNFLVFDIDSGERLIRKGGLQETSTMSLGKDGVWRVEKVRNEAVAKC